MRFELFKARKEAGFTQQQIAKVVGVSHASYNRYEQGLADPTITVAVKIAKAYGKSVEKIFCPSLCQNDKQN